MSEKKTEETSLAIATAELIHVCPAPVVDRSLARWLEHILSLSLTHTHTYSLSLPFLLLEVLCAYVGSAGFFERRKLWSHKQWIHINAWTLSLFHTHTRTHYLLQKRAFSLFLLSPPILENCMESGMTKNHGYLSMSRLLESYKTTYKRILKTIFNVEIK